MTERRRELGFGPPVELMFFVVAIGLVCAAWIPSLIYRLKGPERRACAERIDAQVTDPLAAKTCPVSDAPLVMASGGGVVVVRCPNPDRHGLSESAAVALTASRGGPDAHMALPSNPEPMSWLALIAGFLGSLVASFVLVALGMRLFLGG